MSNSSKQTAKHGMDAETAMAFASHEFELRHPRDTWPTWLRRCTVASYGKDQEGRFIVSLAVTPKATNNAVSYFQAIVDPFTAETTVVVDDELSALAGEDLQGY